MRWPFIIEFWTARLLADPALKSVMGYADFVYPAQASRPVKVPSIEYIRTGDTLEELFNPIDVQVDYWARGIVKASRIEERIHHLTHRDVMQVLGGEKMWLLQQNSFTQEYPADPGVVHGIMSFVFRAARSKYVRQ